MLAPKSKEAPNTLFLFLHSMWQQGIATCLSLFAISIVTMAITPVACSAAPKLMNRFLAPHISLGKGYSGTVDHTPVVSKEHVVIVGFGLMGRSVVRALKQTGIDYIILETNAKTVSVEKKNGEHIVYGDASREAVLEFVEISRASTLVLTIPDMEASKAIITVVRRQNPSIDIIARARFLSETTELYRLGADEVIVDEKEAGVRIFKRLLSEKNLSGDDLLLFEKEVRNEVYGKYIEQKNADEKLHEGAFTKSRNKKIRCAEVEHIRVEAKSDAAEKTLNELHLRAQYGISVLAVKPSGTADSIVSPDGATVLHPGDILVVMGSRKGIAGTLPLFAEKKEKT